MGDLAGAADRYRQCQAALEKARSELEEAIAAAGFVELHRHVSDGRVIDALYQRLDERSGDAEVKHFEEFAARG